MVIEEIKNKLHQYELIGCERNYKIIHWALDILAKALFQQPNKDEHIQQLKEVYEILHVFDKWSEMLITDTEKVTNIPGIVYFFQSGFSEHIKIGYAKNLENRIKSFSTTHANKGKILLVIPGNLKYEKQLHKKFKEQHYGLEWFKYEGKLKEFIEMRISLDL